MKKIDEYTIQFPGLRDFWRNSNVTRGAKVVLMDLLLYANKSGKAFPSEATLASDLGYSERQIRNLLKELQTIGVTWKRGKVGKSNSYTLPPSIYKDSAIQRKSVSPSSGNTLPLNTGNTFPPNRVSEVSQRIESGVDAGLNFSMDRKSSVDPYKFDSNNGNELAAFEAWENLEPTNPDSFTKTYLAACRRGLPQNLFYTFTSEIMQDPTIKNKGAVFNTKVSEYFARKKT